MSLIKPLSIASIVTLISACGGGGGSGDAQNEIAPVAESDNYTAVMVENAPQGLLQTALGDQASDLTINSAGFPNRITRLQLADGEVLSDANDIAQWFELSIDAITGRAKLSGQKTLDFEQDPEYFILQLQLGERNVNVRVNVYDIQNGSVEEALKISSYGEMLSFFNGHFISENIGFDIIDLGAHEDSQTQNRDGIAVALGRDIDASASQQTPWQGKLYKGDINGNNFVINNLNTTWASESVQVSGNTVWPRGFVVSASRFEKINIRNIGFADTRFNSVLFSIDGNVSNVFIEGIYVPFDTQANRINVAPFATSGFAQIEKIYTNVLYDLRTLGSLVNSLDVSGMLGFSGSTTGFTSGYSNGAVITADNLRVSAGARMAGFSQRCSPALSFSSQSETYFYSAMDYQVSDERGGPAANRPYIAVGGLADERCEFFSDAADKGSSDYTWRFVSDRNNNSKPRTAAIIEFDNDNDGISDAGSSSDFDLAAVTEAELKQASSFTGPWQQADSPFDIQQGQYPVLKNMPYPHTPGASWMSAADPGAAFQRERYNRYLTAP